jgi:phospholipid-transporting ATPase
MLLRGCYLRNTEEVTGIVINVGHSTKMMMNFANSRNKQSRNEKMLNQFIYYIFLLQLGLCIFCSMYATLWERSNIEQKLSYLEIQYQYKKKWLSYLMWALVRLGSWIIMFTYFIPISLVVTIEAVRVG